MATQKTGHRRQPSVDTEVHPIRHSVIHFQRMAKPQLHLKTVLENIFLQRARMSVSDEEPTMCQASQYSDLLNPHSLFTVEETKA